MSEMLRMSDLGSSTLPVVATGDHDVTHVRVLAAADWDRGGGVEVAGVEAGVLDRVVQGVDVLLTVIATVRPSANGRCPGHRGHSSDDEVHQPAGPPTLSSRPRQTARTAASSSDPQTQVGIPEGAGPCQVVAVCSVVVTVCSRDRLTCWLVRGQQSDPSGHQ